MVFITMLILIIILLIIFMIAFVYYVKTNEKAKKVFDEVVYELIYDILGMEGIIEDVLCRSINKAILSNYSTKVALITGGCRGIGVEVIKMLLKCDITIIVGCRNVNAARTLLEEARKEGITTGDIKPHTLDISSLESVRQFSEEIKKNYKKIHILINNAGIMYVPYTETVDGYESQFATNYLGHFLLTHELLPLIKAAGESESHARIINVNTIAHARGEINFDDINFKKSHYIAFKAYSQSKLAQMLFTLYLDKLLKEENNFVQVNAVHPGIVDTNLFNDTLLKRFLPWFIPLIFKKPIDGAQPIVYTSISPNLEGKGGTYISNCRIYPIAEIAKSDELQEKLFNFTNNLLNIKKFGASQEN